MREKSLRQWLDDIYDTAVGDDFVIIMMTFVFAPGIFRWTMMTVLAALFLALVHVITA